VSEHQIEWIDSSSLNPDEASQAASWLRELDEDYYAVFGLADSTLESVLIGLLQDAGSEFGPARFIRRDGGLAAMMTVFPASEVFARRIQVLKALLAASPVAAEARRRLRTFDGAARTVPGQALYLAKIYVSPAMRGTGLADAALRQFIEEGAKSSADLCLHVRQHNLAAIKLYSRHGFAAGADSSFDAGEYKLMTKELKR
jgi:ribosomal protein S18 acetylase RimI-like enzyme